MPKKINIEAERRVMMLETPVSRLILKMAFPTVVAMLVTALYSMVDTYFVSSLGTSATGAVGVNMSIDQAIMTAGSFLAIGANSYIARLLGAKQRDRASQTISTAFFTAFLLGVLAAAAGLFYIDPLIVFLGATEDTKPYAVDYAGYILIAAPFMASSFVLSHCLRSEGSPVYSLIGMASGAVLNAALAPVFIFTLGLEVKGAAIAAAISKFVSFCILILPYLRRKSLLRLSVRLISFSRDIVREISLMGMPSLMRMALSVICMILVNNLAGSYSDSALAAVSVTSRIMMLPVSVMLGFGQGFMPVAGYNWGAVRFDRVRQSFRFSAIVSALFIAAVSGLMIIFAERIILLFTESDAEMLSIGKFCLISQCIVMTLNAFVIIVNMLFTALGRPVGAIILGISRQGFCFIPLFFVLPGLFGVWGLAATQAAADVVSFLIVIPFAIHAARLLRKAEGGELKLPDPGN